LQSLKRLKYSRNPSPDEAKETTPFDHLGWNRDLMTRSERKSSSGTLKLKLKLFTTCTVCPGFSPKAGCVGCRLWALPTMPYRELTSHC
jgi:hypothetical protein